MEMKIATTKLLLQHVSIQTQHNLKTQSTAQANENVISFIGYVFGHKAKVCKVLDKLEFLTDDGAR